jgi:hypothetical protein
MISLGDVAGSGELDGERRDRLRGEVLEEGGVLEGESSWREMLRKNPHQVGRRFILERRRKGKGGGMLLFRGSKHKKSPAQESLLHPGGDLVRGSRGMHKGQGRGSTHGMFLRDGRDD